MGLHHSAIEIQGVEYSYGGNPSSSESGVFRGAPLQVPGATYYRSYNMGSFKDVKHIYDTLSRVQERFKANEYSLVQ